MSRCTWLNKNHLQNQFQFRVSALASAVRACLSCSDPAFSVWFCVCFFCAARLVESFPPGLFFAAARSYKSHQTCCQSLPVYGQRTSAARAAALLASSGLLRPLPPADPKVRPGVLEVSFCCGTGARAGCGASEFAPSGLPGDEKLSSLFADFEQILPILSRRLIFVFAPYVTQGKRDEREDLRISRYAAVVVASPQQPRSSRSWRYVADTLLT